MWIEALGWTLLYFVWQGLVIGAGFAAVRALLPKERCDARYATGLAALALTAICPALTFCALLHRAPWAKRNAATGDGQECIQRTGSHICRRADEPR
jgi:hypothetical protein